MNTMEIDKSTLISLYNSTMEKFPDAVAVRGDFFSFSYKEFFNASCHCHLQLSKAGVRDGEIVGLMLERSAEMLIGIFGALRKGCAYLPIDPSNPHKRTISILSDADVKFVITQSHLVNQVKDLGFVPIVPTINISTPSAIPPSDVYADSTAYILFTSGSTGKPKGVVVAHSSVVNLIEYIQARYPLEKGDVVLLKSPYTFDGSVWELFGWILMGGTLYIANPGAEKDVVALTQIIRKEKINFLFFVPSMLGAFLDYCAAINDSEAFSSLKWVSVGGEVLPVPMVNRFYELLDAAKARLINVYGPTETTVYATTYLCSPNQTDAKIPIGEAVSNDYIYILDENLKAVAAGDEGEICIGGAGVAKGYLNRPELTAERFVADPFVTGGVMYRTGDIGRRLENGLFDFIGRRDFQVKLRGQRIELGEIEYALQQIPELSESIVVLSKDRFGDDCIVAYLRPKVLSHIESDNQFYMADSEFVSMIVSKLSRYLTSFMIPAEFVICRAFPLTANGKIDRTALIPIAELTNDRQVTDFVPHNDIEKRVVEIWCEVLGRKRVGEEDEFFRTGGHSLKAIQVISSIIKAFGCQISLKEFYNKLTIGKLCRLVEMGIADESTTEQIEKNDSDATEFPLTPVQTEMWVVNNFDETGLTHNIQIEFKLSGNIDVPFFEQKLRETILAEEAFRSTFPSVDGHPIQKVHSTVNFGIPFDNLSALSHNDRNEAFESIVLDNGNVRFMLEKLPLFSFRLIKYATDDYRLLLSIHHLIFDGWSLNLFMKRLHQRLLGIAPETSANRNGDYALWLKNRLKTGVKAQELEFWKQRLSGIPERITLPLKPNCNLAKAGRYGNRHWWSMPKATTAAIDQLALQLGVTPFVVVMSAFQMVLSSASGQNDVVVGTPFANRSHPLVNDLIGYFTNMVSIRTKIDPKVSLRALIEACNEISIDAFSHASVPFGEVAKHIGGNFVVDKNPIYQVIFVMQNWPHEQFSTPEFSLTQKEIGNRTSKIDLLLNVELVDDAYTCWLEFDTMLYRKEFIGHLSSGIGFVLNSMLESVDNSLSDVLDGLSTIIAPASQFSAILVGEGSLLMQCLDVLLSHNIAIKSIVTTDLATMHAAQRHKISCYSNPSDLTQFESVDYIFSINNGLLLNSEFLSFAKKEAINYHDSPLPRYAGMYATNQALLNGESDWAVSWHRIVDEIDAGDILYSEKVDIYPDDTALSLNNRCFEVSVWSFSTLVERLKSGTLTIRPQNKAHRTYFGLSHRPESMGLMQWDRSSDELSALLRACNTGDYLDNEFLMPSIVLNGKLYFVAKASVRKGNFGAEGEVIRYKKSWAIACRDGCVVFDRLYNTFCEEVDLESIFEEGIMQLSPDIEAIRSIGSKYRKLAKYEAFWRNLLQRSDFLSSPCVSSSLSAEFELPLTIFDQAKQYTKSSLFATVATFASLFALKMSHRSDGLVAVLRSDDELQNEFDYNYFSKWVPFYVAIDDNDTLEMSLLKQVAHFEEIERAQAFCSNICLRSSSLRGYCTSFPSIVIAEERAEIPLRNSDNLIFIVGNQRISIRGASESVVKAFAAFVEKAIMNLQTETKLLPLFSLADARRSFSVINSPVSEPLPKRDVLFLFWQTVDVYPNQTVIYDQGNTINYKRFGDDVRRLSSALLSRGVVPGSVVAVSIERSYEYFLSILSVLSCGAAFLPIDPILSLERRRFMVEDANAVLVLSNGTDESIAEGVPTVDLEKIHLDEVIPSALPEIDLQELAYIIYTSGSTGMPKGVKIDRSALANFISAAMSLYDVSPEDRILQFSNLSFDASIEEIFLAFSTGASLYLRNESLLSPAEFINFTIEHSISVWDLPTAFWRQIVAYDGYLEAVETLPLRLVIIGGEAVTLTDVESWASKTPMHRLFNTYGPTETTVVALAHEIISTVRYSKHIPLGRPLSGYFAQIVDENRGVLPEGIIGELFVGGESVSQGYVSASDSQSQAFDLMTLPNGAQINGYKTGDLVFSDSDGLVYYVGRKDEQVKIRGFRIEPEGIAQHICKIDEVEDCAVIAFKRKSGEKSLAAFYTTRNSKSIESSKIKEVLFDKIPNYMIPQLFQQLDFIPLTSNGKVDKRILEQHAYEMTLLKKRGRVGFLSNDNLQTNEGESEYRTKMDENAIQLLNIVHQLSGDGEIGFEHDLLFSGFDSLKFIRLIVEVESVFGIRLSISDIYKYPTVGELAQVILDHKSIAGSDIITCIREGKSGETPLCLIWGAGQQVLQFNDLALYLDPNLPVYVLHAPIVNGEVDIPDTLEALAWLYVNEIERLFPMQRVHLAGYSFGGFVVYEMARLMLSKGFPFDKLFVLDASSVFVKYEDQLSFLYKTVVIRYKLLWLLTRSPLKQFFTIIKNIREIITVFRIKQRIIEDHIHSEETPLEFNELLQHKAEELTHQYVIRPLKIEIFLLTSKSHIKFGGLRMRWQRYAKLGVRPYFIKSYHAEIFSKANIEKVAHWFNDCLRK
ncbi:MAG: amino acid adenylation domain-containing protein [Bacteroidales bacterium]